MSDMHELATFYAIGALEGDERRDFELHLDECEACRAEVTELSPGVELLMRAVAEPAPAELRPRVEGAIDRISGPVQAPAEVIPIRPANRMWQVIAGVAAAAALVFSVAYLTSIGDARFGDQVAEVLAAADATVVQASSTLAGETRFVYSADLERGVFSGSSIPAIGDDRTYQLWVIDDQGASSLGLFYPDDTGGAVVVVDGALRSGVVLGVTNEPEGGSDQPTGDVLLAADL